VEALEVKGKIRAQEVEVTLSDWSDFVFEDGYRLPGLDELEAYIRENRRLPDIPTEKELREGGLSVSDMLNRQMQKIEELTLYVIQLKKENNLLKRRITRLEQER
jgi:hypothetical protein